MIKKFIYTTAETKYVNHKNLSSQLKPGSLICQACST